MNNNNDQHINNETIEVHIDEIIGNAAYDDTLTLTLPMWQWIALSKLAEHHNISVNTIVATWVERRLDHLTTNVDLGDEHERP